MRVLPGWRVLRSSKDSMDRAPRLMGGLMSCPVSRLATLATGRRKGR